MTKKTALVFVLAALFFGNGPPVFSANETIPNRIEGVDLKDVNGWLANRYAWQYFPEFSTVHPVDSLWDPPRWDPIQQKYIPQYQSPFQVAEETRLLEEYGSGADILEFNVCPDNSDYNQWLRTYLGSNSSRMFFVQYEHQNGNCNYIEFDGPKNMDLAKNRQAFADDIEFIIKNVVLPNQSRYITVNGRAVIYLWSTVGMEGNFASLLRTMKVRYPVFFIGSVNIMAIPTDLVVLRNLQELDGFMEYGIPVFDRDENGQPRQDNYLRMIQRYDEASGLWREIIRKFESQPRQIRKKYLFIPVWQAAYDDTKWPGRDSPPMYPRTRAEMEHHAEVVKRRMASGQNDGYEDFYDNVGPNIIVNEFPEGAAVTRSQLPPEPERRLKECKPGQLQIVPGNPRIAACGYVGYGTGRLEIVNKYFGK